MIHPHATYIPKILGEYGRCVLNRSVISIKGADACKFLHGMCTSDIHKWAFDPAVKGAFAGFLTPQVAPVTIMVRMYGYLLDCDRRVSGDFIFHLKQYKLRNKIDIEDDSARLAVLAEWNLSDGGDDGCSSMLDSGGDGCSSALNSGNDGCSSVLGSGHLFVPDRRCDWKMFRKIVTVEEAAREASADTSVYDTLRMLKGIPEGPVEITRGKAIPMEYNLELMQGVDLHKGCYMGQELVTRTLHRGVVRKRVVPFRLYETGIVQNEDDFIPNPTFNFEGLEMDADFMRVEPVEATNIREVTKIIPQNPFGRIIALLGNIGLALVRLEEIPRNGTFAVHRPHLDAEKSTFLIGRTRIPEWWPANLSG